MGDLTNAWGPQLNIIKLGPSTHYLEQSRQAQLSDLYAAMLGNQRMPGQVPEVYRSGFLQVTKEERIDMSMIVRLKAVAAASATALNGSSVDALVELSAYAVILGNEYTRCQIPLPKWLGDAQVRLRAQIQAQYQVEKEQRKAELRAKIGELRSREEKRTALEEELAELEGKVPDVQPIP